MTDYSKFYQSGPMRVPGPGVPLPPLLRRQAEQDEFLAGAVQRLITQFPNVYGPQAAPSVADALQKKGEILP